MAMEDEDAAAATTTTTSTRRLRTRQAKPTFPLLDKSDDDESPSGSRISSSLKRKATMTIEDLYLQKNYKDPVPTPLETIFDSPRPSRSQRGDSPDVSLLMARRKLKRTCVFGSHYQPTRTKLKHRKERAQRMMQMTGVRVPLGKAFTEDDVQAALSCLTEEEAATTRLSQDPERGVLGLPHTPTTSALMEKVTNVLSSLQVHSEPSGASLCITPQEPAPAPPLPSKEQRRKRRSGLVVSPSNLQTNDHPSQPSRAREKRLKRRSGLIFVDKTTIPSSSTSSPQDAPGNCPPQPSPIKSTSSQRKRQKRTPEAEQSKAARVPRARPENKRTPDSSPATVKKKQCTPDTSPKASAPPSHHKSRRKNKSKHRLSGMNHSLYHRSALTSDPANHSNTPSPTITTDTPPPAPSLTPTKIEQSPKLPNTLKLGAGKDAHTATHDGSPTSPSAKMAALSLHTSPSALPKPKKLRRRSARLSIGSEGKEELWKVKNNSLPLGTLWTALSPMQQGAGETKGDEGDDGQGGGGNAPAIPPATTHNFTITPSPTPAVPALVLSPSILTPITPTPAATPATVPDLSASLATPNIPTPATSPATATAPALTLTPTLAAPLTPTPVVTPASAPNSTHTPSLDTPLTTTPVATPATVPNSVHTPSLATPLPPTPAVTPATVPSAPPIPSLTPSPGQAFSTLTPSQSLLPAPTLTPHREQSPATLTPSPARLPPPTLTPQTAHPPATPLTPSQEHPPAIPLTPSQEHPPATPLTPSPGQQAAFTPSQEQPLAPTLTPCLGQVTTSHITHTPSPGHTSAIHITPSVTPAPVEGEQNAGAGNWDSPIIAGIFTNQTMIKQGQVYYAGPLAAPSPARV